MDILIAYFSSTGNTRKMAEAVSEAFSDLGAKVTARDVTSFKDREENLDLSGHDAVVFGFPIFVNRAPAIMREWLGTLEGGGRKCSTFFTYGGVNSHPAHRSTRAILEGKGFDLVSSAEFLGEHTYNRAGWEAMVGRPDESDLEVAREYAAKTLARFKGEDRGRPGEFPEGKSDDKTLDQIEKGMRASVPQLPSRMGADCGMCMDCQDLCPTSAMDAQKGEAARDKCILCLRCLAVCPENALKFADMSAFWKSILAQRGETRESLAQKKSRLYL